MSLVITTNGNGVTIDDGINSPVSFVNVHYSWFFTNGALNLSAGKCNFIAGVGSVEVDGNTPTNEADLNTALGAVFPADSGGSGSSLFPTTGTGTATGNVIGDLGGDTLEISGGNVGIGVSPTMLFQVQSGGNDFLSIDPTAGAEISQLQAYNTTDNDNLAAIVAQTSNTNAEAYLNTGFNGGSEGQIKLESSGSGVVATYEADSHTFTGKINFASIQEFADNSAAITGGLVAGDLYRTGDNLKIVH